MRRKRKTKYTWLPIQNGRLFEDGGSSDASFQNFVLDVPSDGNTVTGVVPVVADLPQGTLTTVESEGIGEIIGNEYILKRIVGKCFTSLTTSYEGGSALGVDLLEDAAVIVTAGFFVARADPAVLTAPIGYDAGPEASLLYGPQTAELTRQPWIWRRTWLLGAGGFGPGLTEDLGTTIPDTSVIRGRGSWPFNNAGYGSVADGPHIDAKTGRRIRLEERLWFAAGACNINPTGHSVSLVQTVEVTLDCRYLGALRRPRSRSNFA